MTLLFVYVAVALGFSFLCSLLEATLLTVTPSAIESAKRRGVKWALKMEGLKRDIDGPLSAILTLNTIAHTMGATGAGAQYVRVFGDATGGFFAAGLTLAVLVLTEIIPKTLGARHAMFFAGPTAWLLPWLQWVLTPVVWICRQITKLITFGKADARPPHREELLAVALLGEQEGALRKEEGAVVRNILQLHKVRVADIMTPRPVMFMLSAETALQKFAEVIADKPFSRIPIFGETTDEVLGFVLRSEALQACLKDGDQTLRHVLRPIGVVPDVTPVDRLFRRLLREGEHVMLVRDEYGTLVGLVTLEDVLETVVGVEILDEKDLVADMQHLARDLWRERAVRMGLENPDESDVKRSGKF